MASLDPKVLAELRSLQDGGAPGFLVEIIDIYLRDAEQHVRTLRASLDAKDAPALERAAHTLKGGSGNLGAMGLSKLCGELQGVARAADWAKAAVLVPKIEAEHAASAAELRVEKTR